MPAASNEGSPPGDPFLFVTDYKGREIKVGSKVIYGEPITNAEISNQTAEVIEISDPETEFFENDLGMDVALGVMVIITIQFSDGDKETLRANFIKYDDGKETYEETGDLRVIR